MSTAQDGAEFMAEGSCLITADEIFDMAIAAGKPEEMAHDERRHITRLFYPTRFSTPAEVTQAKLICDACPVREECLAYAHDTQQEHGIWGGTTQQERRIVWRRERAAGTRQYRWGNRPPVPMKTH